MKNFDLWMSISGSLLIAAPIQAQKKAKEKQPNVIFIIYGAQNETYIEGWEKKTSNLLIYKRLCKI